MSTTKIHCRNPTCKKPLASIHHGGAVHFTYGVVQVFDPAGPDGPCLCLQCKCGSRRNFDLVLAAAEAGEIAITG